MSRPKGSLKSLSDAVLVRTTAPAGRNAVDPVPWIEPLAKTGQAGGFVIEATQDWVRTLPEDDRAAGCSHGPSDC